VIANLTIGQRFFGALREFEEASQSSVIVFYCSDLHGKSIGDEDVKPILHMCSELDTPNMLQVVLHGNGGMIHVAHRLGQAFREHALDVKFIVPERARSAATLLCFSGSEVQMDVVACLGPIDPMLVTVPERNAGQPQAVSTEDIKAFSEMASEWFGVSREEFGTSLLTILCQRVFPLSLSAFYRAEKYLRAVATEFLHHPFPNASEEQRLSIIEYFLAKHASHDVLIGLPEAQQAGLHVKPLVPELTGPVRTAMECCTFLCAVEPMTAGVLASRHRVMLYKPSTVSNIEPSSSHLSQHWQTSFLPT
jgi:hypothetical protein